MAQFGFGSTVPLTCEPAIVPGKNLKRKEPFGTLVGSEPSRPAFREPMFEIFKPGYWVCYGCNKIFMETESIGRHLYTCLKLTSFPFPKNPTSASSSSKSLESSVVTVTTEKISSVLPVLKKGSHPIKTKPQQKETGVVTCQTCSRSYHYTYIENHRRICGKGIKRGRKPKLKLDSTSVEQGGQLGHTKFGGSNPDNIFVKQAAGCVTTSSSLNSPNVDMDKPKSELKSKMNTTFMHCKHCSNYIHHQYFQHHVQICAKYQPCAPDA